MCVFITCRCCDKLRCSVCLCVCSLPADVEMSCCVWVCLCVCSLPADVVMSCGVRCVYVCVHYLQMLWWAAVFGVSMCAHYLQMLWWAAVFGVSMCVFIICRCWDELRCSVCLCVLITCRCCDELRCSVCLCVCSYQQMLRWAALFGVSMCVFIICRCWDELRCSVCLCVCSYLQMLWWAAVFGVSMCVFIPADVVMSCGVRCVYVCVHTCRCCDELRCSVCLCVCSLPADVVMSCGVRCVYVCVHTCRCWDELRCVSVSMCVFITCRCCDELRCSVCLCVCSLPADVVMSCGVRCVYVCVHYLEMLWWAAVFGVSMCVFITWRCCDELRCSVCLCVCSLPGDVVMSCGVRCVYVCVHYLQMFWWVAVCECVYVCVHTCRCCDELRRSVCLCVCTLPADVVMSCGVRCVYVCVHYLQMLWWAAVFGVSMCVFITCRCCDELRCVSVSMCVFITCRCCDELRCVSVSMCVFIPADVVMSCGVWVCLCVCSYLQMLRWAAVCECVYVCVHYLQMLRWVAVCECVYVCVFIPADVEMSCGVWVCLCVCSYLQMLWWVAVCECVYVCVHYLQMLWWAAVFGVSMCVFITCRCWDELRCSVSLLPLPRLRLEKLSGVWLRLSSVAVRSTASESSMTDHSSWCLWRTLSQPNWRRCLAPLLVDAMRPST